MARANFNKSNLENGLPVLGEDDDELLDKSNSAYKRNPPLSNRVSSQQSRRTPTPTKQISLTAVKRREDSFYQEDDQSVIDELKQSMKLEAERSFLKESPDYVVERNTTSNHVSKAKKTASHNCLHNGDVETAVVKDTRSKPQLKPAGGSSNQGASAKPPNKKSGKREESSSSEDSSEEEEERKAPNQLLMEFLECIYAKDFPNAAKLCKMILIYEPDHPVALQFQPVIAEKIQLDLEAEEEGSDDDDDEDSGEEEDTDDDSDDDDDSDSDDSSDEVEEEENDENSGNSGVEEIEDSGIASTDSSDRDFYEM